MIHPVKYKVKVIYFLDPGFLITEEEARLRQQEKLEQEAEIYRGKEKEVFNQL